MNNINSYININTFKFRPIPSFTLPAVYNDVMSYEQQIGWLTKNFEELVSYVSDTLKDIDVYINASVENKFTNLAIDIRKELADVKNELIDTQKGFSDLEKDVSIFKKEVLDMIEKETKDQKEYIDSAIRDQNINIEKKLIEIELDLYAYVGNVRKEMRAYSEMLVKAEEVERVNAVDNLQKQIDELFFESPKVFNIWQIRTTSLGEWMKDEWYYNRPSALTVDQYDSLGMTVEEIDALNMTTAEHDTATWYKMFFPIYQKMAEEMVKKATEMFSPYSGEKEHVRDVIVKLFSNVNINGKNTEEYDANMPTVEEFDDSSFNTFEQDTNKSYTNVNDINNVDDVLLNSYFVERKKIWENDIPNEPVRSITIERKASVYELLSLEYDNGNGGIETFLFNGKGGEYVLNQYDNVNDVTYFRTINVSEEDIKIASDEASENELIPLNIYGYNFKSIINKEE